MVCDKCGTELFPNAKFCQKCGCVVNNMRVNDSIFQDGGHVNNAQKNKELILFGFLKKMIWVLTVLDVIVSLSCCAIFHLDGSEWLCSIICMFSVFWLVAEVVKRKNWARLTYTYWTLPSSAMQILFLIYCLFVVFDVVKDADINIRKSIGTVFVFLLSIGVKIMCIGCNVMLFIKPISSCFMKTKHGLRNVFEFFCAVILLCYLAVSYENGRGLPLLKVFLVPLLKVFLVVSIYKVTLTRERDQIMAIRRHYLSANPKKKANGIENEVANARAPTQPK